MKRVLILALATILFGADISSAQKKKQKQDVASILEMTGCYQIKFNFAETFAPDKAYKFHDNYLSGGLEWVFPIVQEDDKVVLQHLLVISDTMIIKHWRQDWLFENTDMHVFDKENTWKYQTLDKDAVKGQWTQNVYQVDDGPRYAGSGTWVHVDGKHYWESTADAPLPRREFSKRSDYNVMIRRNRQEITDYGWVHEQDNQKIIRGSEDVLLASEKGWNTYTKVDSEKCQPAVSWWEANQAYWADVRSVWTELFAAKQTVKLNMKVEDKILFQRLFALGAEWEGKKYESAQSLPQIKKVIRMHLASDISLAQK